MAFTMTSSQLAVTAAAPTRSRAASRAAAASVSPAGAKLAARSSFAGAALPAAAPLRAARAAQRRGGAVAAMTVPGEVLITVDKPLGLTLADKKGGEGGVVVASVSNGGNAAKAGIKAGDTVLYTSSFFGDELWPADKAAFTRTAINAKQNDVDFVIIRGKQADEVNVKRLKARPSPPRFGRKLTAAQKARATHICLDCGFIYFQAQSFDELPNSYECPQCAAPKSRFAGYDAETGKTTGKGASGLPQVVSLVGAIGAVGILALVILGLQ